MEDKYKGAFYDKEADKNGLLQYHIKLKKGDIARYVLLPGDPKRVGFIAKYLDEAILKADYREYVTITGKYKNIPVSITSTGIGGPSASIAMEELIKIGADTFIRVGTAGGLSLKVKPNDLAIAQAAIKDEGTSKEYIPFEYPAIANTDIIFALRDAAIEKNYNYHIGVVHSKDCFYGELEPQNSFFREKFLEIEKHLNDEGILELCYLYSIFQNRKLVLDSSLPIYNLRKIYECLEDKSLYIEGIPSIHPNNEIMDAILTYKKR